MCPTCVHLSLMYLTPVFLSYCARLSYLLSEQTNVLSLLSTSLLVFDHYSMFHLLSLPNPYLYVYLVLNSWFDVVY